MATKLTLSMDEEVIKRAKAYAKKSGRSLSGIIQTYLDQLTDEGITEAQEIDPIKKLYGCVDIPKDFDDKEMIRQIAWEREK